MPNNQVVALDRFEIAALVDGLRRQRLLAEVALPAALIPGAQVHLGVVGDDAQVAVEIAVVEHVAFAHQSHVFLENAFRARHTSGVSLEFQGVVTRWVLTRKPDSMRRIFSSRVPNRLSIPRLICTLALIEVRKDTTYRSTDGPGIAGE